MFNSTTFTIESVHGLKQTFNVNPGGIVDTTKLQVVEERQQESQPKRTEDRMAKAK
ncbi:hypothetical protein [Stieleria marina]|uniref:Uncharacterized protein n=1 Tax=Stieleria marina TaxID=1930275 RepID=A0A517NR16_9BACT|nr:hypothetical protein K239x_15080 [Planctomycetes bacterium K23_9]